jgi:hypothetical protein
LRAIPIDIANPITNRAPGANADFGIAMLSLGKSGSTTSLGQEFQGSFSNIVLEQAR